MGRTFDVGRLTERFVVAASGTFLAWYVFAKISTWPGGPTPF